MTAWSGSPVIKPIKGALIGPHKSPPSQGYWEVWEVKISLLILLRKAQTAHHPPVNLGQARLCPRDGHHCYFGLYGNQAPQWCACTQSVNHCME